MAVDLCENRNKKRIEKELSLQKGPSHGTGLSLVGFVANKRNTDALILGLHEHIVAPVDHVRNWKLYRRKRFQLTLSDSTWAILSCKFKFSCSTSHLGVAVNHGSMVGC